MPDEKMKSLWKAREKWLQKVAEDEAVGARPEARTPITGYVDSSFQFDPLPTGAYAKLERDKGIKLPFRSPGDWEKIGYGFQTEGDKWAKVFGGLKDLHTAAFWDSLGSDDPREIFKMAMGTIDGKPGNFFHDWADENRERSTTENHIFRVGDGGMGVAEHIQNFGYTLGMMSAVGGPWGAAIGAATGGSVGMAKSLTPLAKAGAKAGERALRWMTGTLGTSMHMSINESHVNGLETYRAIYEKYTDLGYSEEEARKLAAEGATRGFRREFLPQLATNYIQFLTIGMYAPKVLGRDPFQRTAPQRGINPGYSGAVESVAGRLLPKMKNPYAKTAVDTGLGMAAEAFEEGTQTGISREAQYYTDRKTGEGGEKPFWDMIWEGHEMGDSMIGGAMGGAFFTLGGKGLRKLTTGTPVGERLFGGKALKAEKEYEEKYNESIAKIERKLGAYKKAGEAGDAKKMAEVRGELTKDSFFVAMRNDIEYQSDRNTSGYISNLETAAELAERAANGDADALSMFEEVQGTDFATMARELREDAEKAKKIKDRFVENYNEMGHLWSALDVTENEYYIEQSTKGKKEAEDALAKLKKENAQYQALSEEEKRKLDLGTEMDVIQAILESRKGDKDFNESTRAKLEARKEALHKELIKLKKDGEAEQFGVDTRSFAQSYADLAYAEANLEVNQEDIAHLKDAKNMAERNELAAKYHILNASTKRELTRLWKELDPEAREGVREEFSERYRALQEEDKKRRVENATAPPTGRARGLWDRAKGLWRGNQGQQDAQSLSEEARKKYAEEHAEDHGADMEVPAIGTLAELREYRKKNGRDPLTGEKLEEDTEDGVAVSRAAEKLSVQERPTETPTDTDIEGERRAAASNMQEAIYEHRERGVQIEEEMVKASVADIPALQKSLDENNAAIAELEAGIKNLTGQDGFGSPHSTGTSNAQTTNPNLRTEPLPRQVTSFEQAREVAKQNFIGKVLTNVATGMKAVASVRSLRKMLSKKAVDKSHSGKAQALAAANADVLFERSIFGWTKPERDNDPNIKGVHRFFTTMEHEGKQLVVKLTVKETQNPKDNNTLYTIEAVEFVRETPPWFTGQPQHQLPEAMT